MHWTRTGEVLHAGARRLSAMGGESAEKKNCILAGLSYEVNPSALLNAGWAFLPQDVDGKKSQFYAGITVDQTILKEMGLVNK